MFFFSLSIVFCNKIKLSNIISIFSSTTQNFRHTDFSVISRYHYLCQLSGTLWSLAVLEKNFVSTCGLMVIEDINHQEEAKKAPALIRDIYQLCTCNRQCSILSWWFQVSSVLHAFYNTLCSAVNFLSMRKNLFEVCFQ